MSDLHPQGSSIELGRYWAIVKRRWLVVAALTVLGGVLAGLYGLSSHKSYTATTLVNLSVIADQPFSTQRSASGLIDPATEAQLARSSTVLRSAATTLGHGTTIADVRHATAVTVLPEATVARVRFTAPTLMRAVRGADAVGQAYVEYRTAQAQGKVDRIVAKLNARETTLSKQLSAVTSALASPMSRAQRAAVSSQQQMLQSEISAVLGQLSQVSSIDTSGGYVITDAGDSPVSVQPHARLLTEVGIALGLVLGLLGALVVEGLDRRVISAADVAKYRAGRLLADLRDATGAVPAHGPDEESYRLMAEQLLALRAAGHGAFTVIDMTRRPQPAVAANLALALASTSDGAITGVFPSAARPTADLLVSQCDARTVPVAGFEGSAVELGRAAGPRPAATTIIALPSASARSRVLGAVRQAQSVILVLERRHTRGRAIDGLVDSLSAVGGVVVGSILAPPVPRSTYRPAAARRLKHPAPVPARDGA